MTSGRNVLSLRFDVDSIRCIEEGIPELRRLADRFGVRFTFFVNMGRSFNGPYHVRHLLRKRRARAEATPAAVGTAGPLSLPTTRKLGWSGVVRTVALNPRLGDRYRDTFDALHAEGHELGLHGGNDHVIWQRALDELDARALHQLYQPAAETFMVRYGTPAGFASPGFRYNELVLELLDREGYVYASDMDGEEPFQPAGRLHYQVPVNVKGDQNVPLVEQGFARGRSEAEIVDAMVAGIRARRFALMYGHPYVEGVRADLLGAALERVVDEYDVVTMGAYLERWLEAPAES